MGWTSIAGDTPFATVWDIGWHGWSLGGAGVECAEQSAVLCFEQ
jgi:hypothetical protein